MRKSRSWEIEVKKLAVVFLLVVIAAISLVLLLRYSSSVYTGPFVRLVVDEKYENGWQGPVQEHARYFLEKCGFKVIEESGQPYDAILTIKAESKALGAFYIKESDVEVMERLGKGFGGIEADPFKEYIESGAQIAGEISFARKDGETWTNRFEAVVSPPSQSRDFHPDPFQTALGDSGFYRFMAEMIAKAYGIVPLIQAHNFLTSEQLSQALAEVGISSVSMLITNKEQDRDLRIKAMQMLSRMEAPPVGALISVLQSDDFEVRFSAIEALRDIGDERVIQPLSDVLQSDDFDTRFKAVEALGEIGDQNAVEPLIGVLEGDQGPYVLGQEAAKALQEITGQSFGQDPEQWSEWWKHSGSKSNNPEQGDIQ